jgi:hypothetical protein
MRLVLAFAAALLTADVAPHCGGPEVVIQKPGQECGAHGSRWRGECRAPASCMYVVDFGDICTASCMSVSAQSAGVPSAQSDGPAATEGA